MKIWGKNYTNKKTIAVVLILLMLLPLFIAYARENYSKELHACLALSSIDNDLTRKLTKELTEQLEVYGYSVSVDYCNGNAIEQIKQIQNFSALGAEIIVVDCIGESAIYEEVFSDARANGVKIMALNSNAPIAGADVQLLSGKLNKGICMCRMLRNYLDEAYGDIGPGGVNVLLLGTADSTSNIQTLAGYQLISEKYIRYYDYLILDYVKEDSPDKIYYIDGYGIKREVEEAAGGLVLDENGMAIINPYYDERVKLFFYKGHDYNSFVDGQKAIDMYISTQSENAINVVISLNSEAAIGAAERLAFYQEKGKLKTAPDKLAVFGADDTFQNKKLVQESRSNKSLLRGFVGDYSVETYIGLLVRKLVNIQEAELTEVYSFFTVISENGTIGTMSVIDGKYSYLPIFEINYEWDRKL